MYLTVFINEKGNAEAINAMNIVNDYLSNSSTIGVTIYAESVEGKKSEPEEFLDKRKFNYCRI